VTPVFGAERTKCIRFPRRSPGRPRSTGTSAGTPAKKPSPGATYAGTVALPAPVRGLGRPVRPARPWPRWMTVTDAAAYLAVSRTTIYALVKQGQLVLVESPIGRRVDREQLDRLVLGAA
jgi:excisionase family DNA binding protein